VVILRPGSIPCWAGGFLQGCRSRYPDILNNKANLASPYRSQGQWKGDEGHEMHVAETIKKILGVEHPNRSQ